MDVKRDLRKIMRLKRNELATLEKNIEAQKAAELLFSIVAKNNYRHIALYLTNDAELDPFPLIKKLWQNNIQTYLPILHPFTKGHLLFQSYTPDSLMVKNKYGISEPKLDVTKVCPLEDLQLILTPLVAFDNLGNRLGMGGGYYDRTLANIKNIQVIGFGYNFQKIEFLETEKWDISCDIIVTPSTIYQFNQK